MDVASEQMRASSASSSQHSEPNFMRPLVWGLSVAVGALAARRGIQAWNAFLSSPWRREFYRGGFQPVMNRREAALILGVRRNATKDDVHKAFRRVMLANHPDAGGSDYLAHKIKQASDMLLNKSQATGSPF